MKRKRKPPKQTRRSDNFVGPKRPTKGREKTYLRREITEETARDIPWEYIKGVQE